MISPGYPCGLRVSEVASLQVADLDRGELVLHIKNEKGNSKAIEHYLI